MRETIPALNPSLVCFESKSDVLMALCSVKEEPGEQAREKDNKTKGGITVWKMAALLRYYN